MQNYNWYRKNYVNLITFTLKCNFNKRQNILWIIWLDDLKKGEKIFHKKMTKDVYPEYVKKSLRPIRKDETRQKEMKRKDEWPMRDNSETNVYITLERSIKQL